MKRLTLLLITCCMLYACKHTPPDTPLVPNPGGGTGTAPVCFQSEILPLFQSFCAKSGCHDAASHKDGYVLDSYINLFKKEGKINGSNIRGGDPENSKLYEVLFESGNDKMPPPGNAALTADQIRLIGRWINEGAKETTSCNTSCDSNQFRFAANIQPIMNTYCTGCHSGPAASAGIRLTTYAEVQPIAISGLLYGTVAHLPGFQPMPKGSLSTIPACEIAQIRKWVAAGAKND